MNGSSNGGSGTLGLAKTSAHSDLKKSEIDFMAASVAAGGSGLLM
jgi:hypothetical protein